ncbi:(2Fe-2S)-binding protein [Trichococcus ilyis]|uniref:Carbon-monoxide dehydrogenase small subunit n=1 Tax=Trichococcus ilyis TaxID=640938 RepID=A0A143ZB33_9LACT|nr:(2Fe-2S)-binding protein [Trichococcus ilyis]CZR08904.1 Hypothetical protein TR210_2649 [Trichococcus ilyis]SEJ81193.1 carbon-monoxide dehydrogenase small subunit [Trichococcus ilyis]
MMEAIVCKLNGQEITLATDPARRLLDIIREDFDCKGTKEGCGEGECGACAVLLDGRLVNSCLITAAMAAGKDIWTIEGYRDTDRFRLLKEKLAEYGSVQCGFCTPGIILAAEAVLSKNPHPTEVQVREGLSGNLCRCTGYTMIVDAILAAAREGEGLW